jgi:hypothetical protein
MKLLKSMTDVMLLENILQYTDVNLKHEMQTKKTTKPIRVHKEKKQIFSCLYNQSTRLMVRIDQGGG